MASSWIIKIVVFLSAFLLFQIELIIGKIFLPRYGGSFMVWGACMVFFQALLLLGYLYAHLVLQKIELKKYRFWHLMLLFMPAFFFPGRAIALPTFSQPLPMVIEVFVGLTLILGPVFFVLSTMSIIYQAWLSQSDLPEAANPYALFAVSNLGSFAALLTYPFFFEMYLDIDIQQNLWRAGYVLVVALYLSSLRLIRFSPTAHAERSGSGSVQKDQWWRWLLFGAAGVTMFLSVTNVITLAVTPMPLLWVLPLAIYLLSYVLNFKKKPFFPAWIKDHFDLLMACGVFFYFLQLTKTLPALIEITGAVTFLFIVCMYCQHELYEERPKDGRDLTAFYTVTAWGGFLGGIIVTWLIPLVTSSLLEYFLGLLAIYAARLLRGPRVNIDRYYLRFLFYWIAALVLWPTAFPRITLFGVFLMVVVLKLIFDVLKNNVKALAFGLAAVVLLSTLMEPSWIKEKTILKHRNYYGIAKVVEEEGLRMLIHGRTIHGTRYFDNEGKIQPLLYFYPETPIGRLMSSDDFNYQHVGVVGLGVGALAMYMDEPGQTMDFFELDPAILTIASKYFEFMERSPAKINHYIGDGRLSLMQIPDKTYDVLVMDAFSGSSIPTHFLTVEAMELSRKKIKDDGVVLFHISNQLFDPLKVLFATAYAAGGMPCYLDGRVSDPFGSKWFALTWDARRYETMTGKLGWMSLDRQSVQDRRVWTDRFSNVLPYINFLKGVAVIKK